MGLGQEDGKMEDSLDYVMRLSQKRNKWINKQQQQQQKAWPQVRLGGFEV